jgi:hypothetical protein
MLSMSTPKGQTIKRDIWRRCLENSPTIPEASDGRGWKVERNAQIAIDFDAMQMCQSLQKLAVDDVTLHANL